MKKAMRQRGEILLKKLAILSTVICIIISIILIGIIRADAKTIYNMVWVGEDVETGDTIDVSNNTTFPQYHGVYANGANILDITHADNVTVITGADAGDAVRTNPANTTSTAQIRIGNDWTLIAHGDSADGVNLNGYSSLVAGDNLTIRIYGKQGTGQLYNDAFGLRTNHGAKMNIGSGLDIETTYNRSYAIYLSGSNGGEINIGQNSKINTNGETAHGAYFSGTGNSLTVDSGSAWTTNGKGANVLNTNGNESRASIGSKAVWTTKGADAAVLKIGNYRDVNVDIGGNSTLQSLGNNSSGVYMGGAAGSSSSYAAENRLTLGNNTIIATAGDQSHGIHIATRQQEYNGSLRAYYTTGNISLGANSHITTDGDGSHGVYMTGIDSTVDIGANTKVETKGDGSHALFGNEYNATESIYRYHYGKNGKINAGDGVLLSTSGTGSHGAYTAGDTTAIEFKGGAAISASGADSYALYAEAGKITSLLDTGGDVTAGGRFAIIGDMKTGQNGLIDLMTTEGSAITGRAFAGDGNITLDMKGTHWRVTGDSDVTKITAGSGTNIDLSGAPLAAELHVGSLTTHSPANPDLYSTFTFKTDGVNELANRLVVEGSTDGYHKVSVVNDGSLETTGNERITLIEKADKGGSFSLTNTVELGAFQYGLRNNEDGRGRYDGQDGHYWELYSTGLAPVDPGKPDPIKPDEPEPKPESSNTASAAINTFAANYLLNYAETNTLIQRLGDLRFTENSNGAWFRAYGGKFESNARSFVKDFDMDYGGLQAGYDRKLDKSWFKEGDTYVGVFFGYGKGDLDYKDNGHGSGTAENKTLGLYATYVAKNGFYIDTIAKYVWSTNDFRVFDTAGTLVVGDDVDLGGFGASVEIGRRFRLKENRTGGRWYVEPQAQLSYLRQGSAYFSASNGLRIGVDDFNSLLGRLGALIGYETDRTNFYAKISYLKEFDGDLDIRYASGKHIAGESFGDDWWTYGIGVTHQVNPRNSLYFSLERSSGGVFTEDWAIRGGWRVTF